MLSFARYRQRLAHFDLSTIVATATVFLFGFSLIKIFYATTVISTINPLDLERPHDLITKNITDSIDLKLDDKISSQLDVPSSSSSRATVGESKFHSRQNATIMTLCRDQDMWEILRSVRRLEDRFNHKYHYDWVFLNNEDFSDEFKKRLSSLVSGEAKFGIIPEEQWGYPSFVDQEKARVGREKMAEQGIIYAELESYRHMCRFNSGFFYEHPLMKQYKYYWRVEPDVKFFCDIDYDPFKYLKDNNKVYGFTISIHEFVLTIESLWGHVREFMDMHPEYIHKNNFMDFLSEDGGETYNLCHFWSNFEIADMDFWRSKAYSDFFKYLDSTGGFFYERWGDAPVHSIGVSLFADRDQIHYFEDIGYNHGVYSMCPIDEDIWLDKKCSCEPNSDFTFRGYSCGQHYYKVTGKKKPSNWEEYADL